MNRIIMAVSCAVLCLNAKLLFAQGMIVDPLPVPPQVYEVSRVAIDADIHEQVAQVQVTQVFRNPSRRPLEVEYWFPLPEGGAVQNLVL